MSALLDMRSLARRWVHRPGPTLLAVITLALGIATVCSVFSAVGGALVHRPPVSDTSRFVWLFPGTESEPKLRGTVSLPVIEDYRSLGDSWDAAALYRSGVRIHQAAASGDFQAFEATVVSRGYFDLLEAPLYLGRGFSAGGVAEAVLSFDLWQRRFGADPAILGTPLEVHGEPFEVVGVAAEGFQGLDLAGRVDLWLPVDQLKTIEPTLGGQEVHRSSTFFTAFARLKPGVSVERAREEVRLLGEQLGAGQTQRGAEGIPGAPEEPWIHAVSFGTSLGVPAQRYSWMLLLAAGLVLGCACLDAVSLVLAGAERRNQTLSLRIALGAGPRGLLRPLVLEAVGIAVLASALGLLLTWWAGLAIGPAAVATGLAPAGAAVATFAADGLAFALALTVGVGLVLVAVPALRLRRALGRQVGGQGAAWTAQGRISRGSSILVMAQVAASVALVAGAFLLWRSWSQLAAIDPGYRSDQVLVASVAPSKHGYDAVAGQQILEELALRARALAGVESVALTALGAMPRGGTMALPLPGDLGGELWVGRGTVGPEYFSTLEIPVLEGRTFLPSDGRAAAVAVANRSLAEALWPGRSAVGQWVEDLGPQGIAVEIVGVVEDTRNLGLRELPSPVLYLPFERWYAGYPWQPSSSSLLLQTTGPPEGLIRSVRSLGRAVAPDLPFIRLEPLAASLASERSTGRFLGSIFGAQALLALFLVGAGLYGLVSAVLLQRRRELAIRMALGASRSRLARQVYRTGGGWVLAGLGLGALLALWLSRLLSGLLFGVEPADPTSFALALLLPALVAAIAPLGPLRRAFAEELASPLRSP